MKKKSLLFLVFSFLNLVSCNSPKDIIFNAPPQEIKSITYENWTAGRMESGTGTVFIIEFAKPLQNNIQLQKIYYQNLETEIVQLNENKFRANFHYNALNQKHQTSVIANKEFHLKEKEAVLEYQKNSQIYWYKFTQIKEITPRQFP